MLKRRHCRCTDIEKPAQHGFDEERVEHHRLEQRHAQPQCLDQRARQVPRFEYVLLMKFPQLWRQTLEELAEHAVRRLTFALEKSRYRAVIVGDCWSARSERIASAASSCTSTVTKSSFGASATALGSNFVAAPAAIVKALS